MNFSLSLLCRKGQSRGQSCELTFSRHGEGGEFRARAWFLRSFTPAGTELVATILLPRGIGWSGRCVVHLGLFGDEECCTKAAGVVDL